MDKRTASYLKAMATGLSNMVEREILTEAEKKALKRARSAIRGAIGKGRTMPRLMKPKKKKDEEKKNDGTDQEDQDSGEKKEGADAETTPAEE